MRGTSGASQQLPPRLRFIPAYAGNIQANVRRRSRKAVHPRVCGEHYDCHAANPSSYGSSPRMRGTYSCRVSCADKSRFIPAYAGNMRGAGPLASLWPVHPRVCGEHMTAKPRRQVVTGSSPRMRGTCGMFGSGHNGNRFIPAYAGNMNKNLDRIMTNSVHPRVCGEHHKRTKVRKF